jgi:hypothetical protein
VKIIQEYSTFCTFWLYLSIWSWGESLADSAANNLLLSLASEKLGDKEIDNGWMLHTRRRSKSVLNWKPCILLSSFNPHYHM